MVIWRGKDTGLKRSWKYLRFHMICNHMQRLIFANTGYKAICYNPSLWFSPHLKCITKNNLKDMNWFLEKNVIHNLFIYSFMYLYPILFKGYLRKLIHNKNLYFIYHIIFYKTNHVESYPFWRKKSIKQPQLIVYCENIYDNN